MKRTFTKGPEWEKSVQARKEKAEADLVACLVRKKYKIVKVWWDEPNPDHKRPRSVLRWIAECPNGHSRPGTATTAKYVDSKCRWCVKYLTPKDAIERMVALAKASGGMCLAAEEDYKGNLAKIPFECAEGHIFPASLKDISNGTFCSNMSCRQRKTARSKKQMRTYMHWRTGDMIVATGAYEWGVVEKLNADRIDFEWQLVFQIPENVAEVGGRFYILDLNIQLPGMKKKKFIEIKGWVEQNKIFNPKWKWFVDTYGEENCEMWLQQDLYDKGFYWKRKGTKGLFNGFNHGSAEQTFLVKDEKGVIQDWYKDLRTDPLKILSE